MASNTTTRRKLNVGSSGNQVESQGVSLREKGDTVSGILSEVVSLKAKSDGKPFKKYVFRSPSDGSYTHLFVDDNGPMQLREGLSQIGIGTDVEITFTGEKRTNTGRRMKTYDFYVSESSESAESAAS
jgi:hypothetical protein